MFALDPKLQAQLRQRMKRVLIIEANPAYARMLADMLRVLGADNIIIQQDDRVAMNVIKDLDPQLIMTEYKANLIDGIQFTRDLRHSDLTAKACPIIMMKADITPANLTEARNCGVHEMLSKPFAWQDLFKRLQNVLFKPRDWISVASYTGPDRRRFNTGTSDYKGPRKRRNESDGAQKTVLDDAVRALKGALDIFDRDAAAAMQTVMHQMMVIVPATKTVKDPRFGPAVQTIVNDLRAKALSRESLEPQVEKLMTCLGINESLPAQWTEEAQLKAMSDSSRGAAA